VLLAANCLFLTACSCCLRGGGNHSAAAAEGVTLTKTNYHGWVDASLLDNGSVQAIVIPSIGRVMQFGFRGEEGVFWENRDLDGKELSCDSKEWINFGGDKTWPAPEGDWAKFTGRTSWHPPQAFDCMPLTIAFEGSDLIVTSQTDPHYGIRAIRRIHLDRLRPEMTITTTYKRLSGDPASIGIWVITQLKEPTAVFAPLPKQADRIKDFVVLGKGTPPSLKSEGGLVSLTRNPAAAYKLGFESSTLLWFGEKVALRIDSPRTPASDYPDQGSSAEIYTNPDPLRYVELETLGPLRQLKAGETIEQVNRYTLYRRNRATPEEDARRILQ
jgi:hypothetical protein